MKKLNGLLILITVSLQYIDLIKAENNSTVNEVIEPYTDADYFLLNQTFFIIRCILSALSFTCNVAVMFIYLYTVARRNYNKANLLFFLQALTDIIVTTAMTIYVAIQYGAYKSWHLTAQAGLFFYEYSQFLAGATLFFITAERFIAIKYPIHHKVKVTLKVISIAAVVVFAVSAIPPFVSVLYVVPNSVLKPELMMHYYIYKGLSGIFLIGSVFILLVISYYIIRSNITMRKQQFQSLFVDQSQSQAIKRFEHVEAKKHKRVILVLLTICILYVVTFSPGAFYMLFFHSLIKDRVYRFIQWILEYTFNTLYFSTALFNPVLTLVFIEDYNHTICLHFGKTKKTMVKEASTVSDRSKETSIS